MRVQIPKLLVNEEAARIVDIFVKDNQKVKKGDVLCLLETTKSTSELFAECDGYIREIQFKVDDEAKVGDVFCYVLPNLNVPVPERLLPVKVSERFKATNKALMLIEKYKIEESRLPKKKLIKEKDILELVQHFCENQKQGEEPLTKDSYSEGATLLVGGGGYASMCLEILKGNQDFQVVGIVDAALPIGSVRHGIQVVGRDEHLSVFFEKGIRFAVNCVGAIHDQKLREEVCRKLKRSGFKFPTLVHETAVVESNARLGAGVQIMARAYVGPNASIEDNCIVNVGSIISHDCMIAEHSHIAPGAILAGGVKVGKRTLVGMGVTVFVGVEIGDDVLISNGVNIFGNVPNDSKISKTS